MQDRAPLAKGEIVEVHMLIKPPAHLNEDAYESWVDGTVVAIDGMNIGVEIEGQARLALPIHMHGRTWRRKVVVGVETKWGTFTVEMLEKLKLEMNNATKAGQTEFDALGGKWICSFVKYLIEYAEGQGLVIK